MEQTHLPWWTVVLYTIRSSLQSVVGVFLGILRPRHLKCYEKVDVLSPPLPWFQVKTSNRPFKQKILKDWKVTNLIVFVSQFPKTFLRFFDFFYFDFFANFLILIFYAKIFLIFLC